MLTGLPRTLESELVVAADERVDEKYDRVRNDCVRNENKRECDYHPSTVINCTGRALMSIGALYLRSVSFL